MSDIDSKIKPRILIVEDSAIVALELKEYLQRLNYEIIDICAAAEDAVNIAQETEIDLALFDIKLKGEMDGIDGAQIFIDQYEIPVVFLTAHTDEVTLERAKRTKPNGYIIKPFVYEDIKTTIDVAIYKSRADKKIKESEYLFRALVENSQDGIFIVQNFVVVYANEAFANIFGYELSEVINENFITFFAHSEREKLVENYRNRINGKILPREYEVIGLHYDKQTELILNLSAGIILYKDATAVMGTVKDITAQKLAEKTLTEAKEMLEQSDKLKTEFLGQISHEIRTPINNILGFSYLIKEELGSETNDNITNCFRIMDTAGKRLVKTVDQIIQMSQLQIGDQKVQKEIIDLDKDVLEDILLDFFQKAKEKDLSFNYQNVASSQYVECDKFMLGEIITSLIDNAIKYTNEGSVDILVDNYLDNKTVVEIKDTGIGISRNYLKNIFLPFSQEESGYRRSFEGNGLGMALVKKYADLNDIEIEINSEKGKGSSIKLFFESLSEEKINTLNMHD